MSEYRGKVAVGVTGAVLIAAALGLLASTAFPSGSPAATSIVTSTALATMTSSTSAAAPSTQASGSTTTAACTSPCTTSSTVTLASATAQANTATLDYGRIANATMYSPAVQAYVKTAYSYTMEIRVATGSTSSAFVLLNITGTQTVRGNWTTGYSISYSGIVMLNVTVRVTGTSAYQVTNIGVVNSVDRNFSITYSAQQQQAIQVALSSSSVRQLEGGSTYYVEWVSSTPVTNGSYTGDFNALLYQVNGTRIVGAFVNSAETAVVNAYTDSRVTTYCWGAANICFTSPWGAA